MSGKVKRRYIVLAVIILPVVAYWLFANVIIKSIVEGKLSESYGAEVNIAEFDHSLYPAEVEMQGIGLTDAATPSRNKVLVGTARADVELLPLLSDRVIVNNLDLLDVQFDQPRETPGEVYRQPTNSLSFDEIKAKAQEAIPTVDELLARNPLKTSAAVEQAQQTYAKYADGLKENYEALPDSERLDYYKTQIQQLKDTDPKDPQALLQARETLDKLKEEIRADKAQISQFTTNASEAKKALRESVANLKAAPAQDYELLKGIVAGDSAALEQVTQFVFGDKAAEYTEYLMAAVQIVLPLIQEKEGAAEEPTDLPSILVRQADVTVKWKEETISSVWQNITNTHPLVGEPTTFSIAAAGELLKQFESSGQFWIDSDGVDAAQEWSLAGVSLADISFSQSEKLSAMLQKALMATSGSMTVTDNALTGSGNIDLRELVMEASGNSEITRGIAQALQSLSSLDINMQLNGTLADPDFSIKSDLDNQLAQAALSQLTASQQDKLNELNSKLNAMVSQQQDAAAAQLVDVNAMLSAAQGDSEALEALLETQLTSLIDAQKGKLFDKLKSKLGNNN
ncbi:TIGR03545 family protein [Alteromonas sp. ASW11-19]|uniref:TIGR03545 family protein n=1 Tax=Alteromonas salexigens TaxID=2982530 RepID=A0ABT2VIR6_9ALTE|nr:TIGR03545 family protein [Alteromonas salexigens]MCU7552996.1 TIGR03545 family protein [Alteromonas salexigens]